MELLDRIARHRPRRIPFGDRLRTAAVAAIFRDPGDGAPLELLFIRRPVRRGDRWSGNIAFPGGLVSRGDADEAATAIREAREEVGLALGTPVGRLSELLTAQPGRLRPLRVVPFVFRVAGNVTLAPDAREVDAAFFVPWRELVARSIERGTRRVGRVPVRVPLVPLTHGTLWGLTLMMVREMIRIGAR